LKVAVSASSGSIDAPVNPTFGRCPYYVIVETESMAFEAVPNTSMSSPSGAGIGAAQVVAGKGVESVLTGNVGPNATAVLSQAGIKMVTGVQGTVREAVDAFKRGELQANPAAGNVGSFMGGRRGGGRGMGAGRGMGMGRGMGVSGGGGSYTYPYQTPSTVQPPAPTSREQEKEALNQQIEQLESQLKEIKKRLQEIGR